jgi:hypothetical protein
MDPINYMLDVKNPIEEAIRGYTMGRNEIAQRQEMQIQQQNAAQQQEAFAMQKTAAEKAVADAQAGQAAITALIDLGDNATPDDFMRTWAENPAMRDEIAALKAMMAEPKANATIKTTQDLYVSSILGNVDATRGQIQTQYDAAVNSGDEAMAKTLKVILDQFAIDPEAAMQAVKITSGLTLGGFIGFDKLKLLNEAIGAGPVEAADVQSALVGKLATVIVYKNGVVEVRDNRTNQIVTGAAAEKLMEDDKQLMADIKGAVEQSGATGRLQAVVDLGAVAAAADAGGKAAVDLSIEAFKQIGNIRSNILNLDRAIQLVEEEGANTGVIASKLPTWGQATLELENLQKTLGLDVIGAVTFGALSQSELDLAQTVALPTNLNEKELADWLRRKKTAQEKLANYLSQQSRFFSRGYPPGRWFDFLDSGEKDMTAWMRANPPGKATPAATETPTAPETPATATSASETEDKAFMQSMIDKSVRGETLTQAEMNRVNVIAAKGK